MTQANSAVIPDNVGDNVGDLAGMGADLFGSCAESTCAALVIGALAFTSSLAAALYPVLLNAVGIPVSFAVLLFIRAKKEKGVTLALKSMLTVFNLTDGNTDLFFNPLSITRKFFYRAVGSEQHPSLL